MGLISLLLLGSCEEVKEIIPLPSMKATVDGEAWTSIFRATVLFKSNNMITVTGTPDVSENVDKAIIISIFGTETGTYNLTPGTLTAECAIVYKKTANAENGGDNYYTSYDATVTITKIDKDKKQVSGTFSGKLISTGSAIGEISIANGTFENLNYQEQE
jgi:hypothetical protein